MNVLRIISEVTVILSLISETRSQELQISLVTLIIQFSLKFVVKNCWLCLCFFVE